MWTTEIMWYEDNSSAKIKAACVRACKDSSASWVRSVTVECGVLWNSQIAKFHNCQGSDCMQPELQLLSICYTYEVRNKWKITSNCDLHSREKNQRDFSTNSKLCCFLDASEWKCTRNEHYWLGLYFFYLINGMGVLEGRWGGIWTTRNHNSKSRRGAPSTRLWIM